MLEIASKYKKATPLEAGASNFLGGGGGRPNCILPKGKHNGKGEDGCYQAFELGPKKRGKIISFSWFSEIGSLPIKALSR